MRVGRAIFKSGFRVIILGAVLVAAVLLAAPEARAYDFIVTSILDDAFSNDTNPGDGVCSDAGGNCSLRAAMEEALELALTDPSINPSIRFSKPMELWLDPGQTDLPFMVRTTIDASEHWKTESNQPGVVIKGLNQRYNGFDMSGSCTIYGLVITGFTNAGVRMTGTDNVLGSTQSGQGNFINGCGIGVLVQGTRDDEVVDSEGLINNPGDNNFIMANHIGLAHDSSAAVPNTNGIVVQGGADGNFIGGATLAGDVVPPGNYIAGNTYYGIQLKDEGTNRNYIAGNSLGVGSLGHGIWPNGWHGIRVENYAHENYIGGNGYPGNYVYGSGWSGIGLDNVQQTQIEDNRLLYNEFHGVHVGLSASNTIMKNEMHYNQGDGVVVEGATAVENFITQNSITGNRGKGISLLKGGNNNVPSPTILGVTGRIIHGRATGGVNMVEVYEDSNNEGETYLGSMYVDPITGLWSLTANHTSTDITVIGYDSDFNTSEFSSF